MKLYQPPRSFMIDGLVTKASKFKKRQVKLTLTYKLSWKAEFNEHFYLRNRLEKKKFHNNTLS